ncbi:hypothetical protein BOTBODRAFT_38739 [Botryobasidium botryosum FD-172 SS1]|uniref:E2 ubiquitin-conjugating enzyme n=1 Tax=Botryobasidium botryosum (strain FD-172 SS1) TaxID=930990 RepID=A0A067M6N4_BOTB1|nr:hypothetical protein BOTBODRAFT_38739 [Botryobasidium botryosum FD-172 SS1]
MMRPKSGPSSNTPSSMTVKRIYREISDLKKEDMGKMTLAPTEASMFEWKGTIPGPEGSVYEGGMFNLTITIPNDYPFTSPRVMFTTRIYHMNISPQGNICLDILKTNWSPALSLFKVMLSISSLLTDPNPKDPLVPSIASEYTRRRAAHDQTARMWVQLYALPPPPPPPPSPPRKVVEKTTSRKSKGKAPARSVPSAAIDLLSDDGPIVISDEEGDVGSKSKPEAATAATAKGKRKREDEQLAGGSKRGASSRDGNREVIVIDD